jgi:hypothetical protein
MQITDEIIYRQCLQRRQALQEQINHVKKEKHENDQLLFGYIGSRKWREDRQIKEFDNDMQTSITTYELINCKSTAGPATMPGEKSEEMITTKEEK